MLQFKNINKYVYIDCPNCLTFTADFTKDALFHKSTYLALLQFNLSYIKKLIKIK